MRWPQTWGPPNYRKFQRGPINCIVFDEPQPELAAAYQSDGLTVTTPHDSGAALAAGSKWPRVQTGGSDGADAGPTGVPWIEANGYLVQLARALDPERPVWLDYGPPPEHTVQTADMFRLAICDAAAYGGHWIIRPDGDVSPALLKTAEFFAGRAAWQRYQPIARLAVVSDFAGPNRALAVEVLNLLPRRLVPYVAIPTARVAVVDLTGFAAVLSIDKQRPSTAISAKLQEFSKKGGILIQPQSDDPFEVAVQTHLALSRRNDLLRLWNDGSMNVYYTASPDGREHLVQLINYAATNSSDAVTLGLARTYKSAVLVTLDDAPKDLPIRPVRAGIEIQLPPFPVYAAISLRL